MNDVGIYVSTISSSGIFAEQSKISAESFVSQCQLSITGRR